MQKLRVSSNGRFLNRDDGSPFYWFGDTAWELFHRDSREDAERYLAKRVSQRFSIQAVVLAEEDGIRSQHMVATVNRRGSSETERRILLSRRLDCSKSECSGTLFGDVTNLGR